MDIAICVSGQLISNWKQCLDSWKESFSQHSVTWFGHTWTTKSAPNWYKNKSRQATDVEITKDELNELKSSYFNFQNLCIDNPLSLENNKNLVLWDKNFHSQFYGVCKANYLKNYWELKKNKIFDLVVRLRWDLFLQNKFVLPKPKTHTLQIIHSAYEGQVYRIGDMYWQGPSTVYNVVSNFYKNIKNYSSSMKIDEDFGVHHLFAYYCKENSLNLETIYPDVKLFRDKPEYNSGGNHEL